MDHIEEVNSDLTTCKGEQSIVLRTREGGRVVLTNQVHLHPTDAKVLSCTERSIGFSLIFTFLFSRDSLLLDPT